MNKYRRRPIRVEAEQFLPDKLPWPEGVFISGKYFFYTERYPDQSTVIDPGDWIVGNSEQDPLTDEWRVVKRRVSQEHFERFYEVDYTDFDHPPDDGRRYRWDEGIGVWFLIPTRAEREPEVEERTAALLPTDYGMKVACPFCDYPYRVMHGRFTTFDRCEHFVGFAGDDGSYLFKVLFRRVVT